MAKPPEVLPITCHPMRSSLRAHSCTRQSDSSAHKWLTGFFRPPTKFLRFSPGKPTRPGSAVSHRENGGSLKANVSLPAASVSFLEKKKNSQAILVVTDSDPTSRWRFKRRYVCVRVCALVRSVRRPAVPTANATDSGITNLEACSSCFLLLFLTARPQIPSPRTNSRIPYP